MWEGDERLDETEIVYEMTPREGGKLDEIKIFWVIYCCLFSISVMDIQ